jgi:hypothetical protein
LNILAFLHLLFVSLLALVGFHRLVLTLLFWSHRAKRPRRVVPYEWPHVTVQLPLFDERHVAPRLIQAAAALRYPIDRMSPGAG